MSELKLEMVLSGPCAVCSRLVTHRIGVPLEYSDIIPRAASAALRAIEIAKNQSEFLCNDHRGPEFYRKDEP